LKVKATSLKKELAKIEENQDKDEGEEGEGAGDETRDIDQK
jgi:hypothetical protein